MLQFSADTGSSIALFMVNWGRKWLEVVHNRGDTAANPIEGANGFTLGTRSVCFGLSLSWPVVALCISHQGNTKIKPQQKAIYLALLDRRYAWSSEDSLYHMRSNPTASVYIMEYCPSSLWRIQKLQPIGQEISAGDAPAPNGVGSSMQVRSNGGPVKSNQAEHDENEPHLCMIFHILPCISQWQG
jgi:hypothetical protein